MRVMEKMIRDEIQTKQTISYGIGTSQPGCGIDLTGNCGHGLVSNFYAASIYHGNHFGATR